MSIKSGGQVFFARPFEKGKQIGIRLSVSGEKGRTAYADLPVRGFQALIGGCEQAEIFFFRAEPEQFFRSKGFVPHGKRPLPHFLSAVAFQKVPGKAENKFAPFLQIFGRRGDDSRIEGRFIRIARQRGRHERDLHERFQPDGKKKIENVVHEREVVYRPSAALVVYHHVVVEQRMHFDKAETDFPLRLRELFSYILV